MTEQGLDDRHGLKKGLKRRHVTMIALGGVIGAGLFVGSGAVINQTGPAAVLSYLLAGTLVVFVMRMLGEMAVANPRSSSFSDYARMSLATAGLYDRPRLYDVLRLAHRGDRRRSRTVPSCNVGSRRCPTRASSLVPRSVYALADHRLAHGLRRVSDALVRTRSWRPSSLFIYLLPRPSPS